MPQALGAGNWAAVIRLTLNRLPGRVRGLIPTSTGMFFRAPFACAHNHFRRRACHDFIACGPPATRPAKVICPKRPAGQTHRVEAITPALGGRCADPGLFFTGKTDFTADLFEAEHLALDDKALDVDGAQRSKLRNAMKHAVAAQLFPLHPKGRDALTFRPIWRISFSANDDPESASNLPDLDASFADKIIYLKCYRPPVPFFDDRTPGAREAFAATLRRELPAFLAAVDAFDIPADLRKPRFGITEWHHPAILALLDEGDPLRPIAETLEAWIDRWTADEAVREMPTVELYRALDEANDRTLARHRISTCPKHLGRQLATLAKSEAWRGRLTSTSRRVGGRESNCLQACWRIQRDPSP